MAIRARIQDGAIVPMEPLPAAWADGRELYLTDGGSEPPGTIWNGTTDTGLEEDADDEVDWLTDEEYEQFKAVTEQADREAKAWMRRKMGLE